MFRALEAGVSAFVTKNAPIAELLAAIRHSGVAAGPFSRAVSARLLLEGNWLRRGRC